MTGIEGKGCDREQEHENTDRRCGRGMGTSRAVLWIWRRGGFRTRQWSGIRACSAWNPTVSFILGSRISDPSVTDRLAAIRVCSRDVLRSRAASSPGPYARLDANLDRREDGGSVQI